MTTDGRAHIYIKPLSAYGRTIGRRSVGRSVSEKRREGKKQEGKGREGERQTDGRADGVISFAPNVHVAAAVAGELAWQVI